MTTLSQKPSFDWRFWLHRLAWAIGLSVYFVLVYSGCNELTARRGDVGHFMFPWERHIPLVPAMIVPYMSIDLFFFFAPFLCRGPRELRNHAARIVAVVTVAGTCYLLFPLTLGIQRPQVGGIFGPIFKFLHGFDRPYNLAPSLHIALRCVVWPVYVRRTRGMLQMLVKTWFILIGASTLLVWQHHVLDWLTGQALGILALYLITNHAFDANVSRARSPKIAAIYILCAVALTLLGALLLPYGMLLFWPAFSLLAVAVGYLGIGPRIFRKRDGQITPSSRWALGPYYLLERLLRLPYMRGQPYCELLPGLWIGRRLNNREASQMLQHTGVRAVLDLSPEATEARPLREQIYRNIPVLDFTAPSRQQLANAVDWIDAHLNGGVYIHCALGYTRTGTIAASYLIAKQRASSPREALDAIRAVRPGAVLNDRCIEALEAFAHGKATHPPLAV